jgi:hypothetical protein
MLQINQQLDKLAAMHSDFIACKMLPGGHASERQISQILKPSELNPDDEDYDENDAWPVEGHDVLAHVTLAQTQGMSIYLLTRT